MRQERRRVGRNEPCPCGSGKKVQEVLSSARYVLRLITNPVADLPKASRKKPVKEKLPEMDRTKHGYRRVSISYADGTTLSFVVKSTKEFEDAKVRAIYKAIAKYDAGAW